MTDAEIACSSARKKAIRKTHSGVPKSCLWLVIVLTLALNKLAIGAAPAFTVPAGQRQLFLDGGGIAKTENLKRTLHQPRKKEAVIGPNFAEIVLQRG